MSTTPSSSVVYTLREKRNKDPWFTDAFDVPKSSFATVDHTLHKARRALIAPYFSRARVQGLEPTIRAKLDRLVARLDEFALRGQPLRVDTAFSCLTVDIVTQYTNYRCFNYLDSPDFKPQWAETTKDLKECTVMARNVPLAFMFLACLPIGCIKAIYPKLVTVIKFRAAATKEIRDMHREMLDSEEKAELAGQEATLFQNLLRVEEEPEREERALHEFISVVTAGTDTTAHTHPYRDYVSRP